MGSEPVDQGELASLLAAAERKDPTAPPERIFVALYAELHRLARRELSRRGQGLSLGVTTLLHEAYVDIRERSGMVFPDKARFMGYAARVMRGLIIDHARSRRAQKRGGQFELTTLDVDASDRSADQGDLASIGDALDELGKVDAPLAEVVDLKFFCGFSFGEIAAMRGVSERTIQRDWEKARIYLHQSIRSSALD